MHTKALYAGSFDPMTLGHLDIIRRAAKIFDELVIGVTVNLEKKTMFTFEERMDMIKEVTKDMPNVTVDKCEGLLADFVNNNGFNVVVRGLRNTMDFDDEMSMDQLHKHLYKNAETIYITAKDEFSFISSTMARQVVSLGGDGSMLVPEYVLDTMRKKLGFE
ncbi:MAG: pantetheine-phosphate adenylyltransferase [Firmicutes bacterium]|nr:pantetheine-phosphate adenylyltransferase [Bacillota bacterium]MCR4709559.1 pantetheine-phosphate adenylyltransferase [Clostridiales bacterium]